EAQDALATVDLGRADDGTPVLLEWHSALAEPLITVTAPLAEVLALADAVAGHAGDDASVLAWWDTSRRLALFGGVDVRFRDNLARPLLLPAAWESRRSAARTVEAKLWQIDGNQTDDFDVFLDALAAPVTEGVARLRALAGDRHAYVAVHVTDAYRLGAERPARFGIGYKDFPNTGQLHGVVRGVKAWLREQGYDAYLVVPHADTAIRVYFLTDAASADTLLARMLPFTTSNPLQLEEPRVVGNYGGFWVYDLDGAGG
ncbi:MAG: hydroxylamine oxidation protein HaoB, partial [Gammaproteobacteria bacterium]|nr:hydroxylamine oxidation protein HaoB [Gammaproteobacteria bacterium]